MLMRNSKQRICENRRRKVSKAKFSQKWFLSKFTWFKAPSVTNIILPYCNIIIYHISRIFFLTYLLKRFIFRSLGHYTIILPLFQMLCKEFVPGATVYPFKPIPQTVYLFTSVLELFLLQSGLSRNSLLHRQFTHPSTPKIFVFSYKP